jgi:cytochrome c553
MPKRILVVLLAVLASWAVATQAVAQSAKPRTASEVDLKAKLKEIEGNAHQLETTLKAGAKVASFCANCHGDGGISAKGDVPNLAGQNASYLMDQLRAYIDNRRPTTDFKRRLIKVLSVDEKVSLVAFYARQEVSAKPASDAALSAKGKALYLKHCSDCHEADGHGNEDYSRVAGQQTLYLTTALKTYRDSPNARLSRDMLTALKGMNDADIGAMVVYVTSMK